MSPHIAKSREMELSSSRAEDIHETFRSPAGLLGLQDPDHHKSKGGLGGPVSALGWTRRRFARKSKPWLSHEPL